MISLKASFRSNIIIFVSTLLLVSCQTLNFPSEEILQERELLRSKRSNLNDDWVPADPLFDKYYSEMAQGVPGANYYPIWFDSIGSKMNGIILTPASQEEPELKSKGTVLLIHGYAGNLRGYRFLIPELLSEGYTVAALSLPGHGLAGGDRGDIDNFNNYGILVHDFLEQLEGKIPKPYNAVGHSTGCSALMIYNQDYGWDFDNVVFIAPLIRSSAWYPSVTVRFLTKPFIQYYNTPWSGAIAVQVFPMHWLDELKKWNKEVKKYNVKDDEILIFQGDRDSVVDWKYNTKFIKSKYANSSLILKEGGSHTFFFKDEELITDIVGYFNN
ncbi:MAG: alpha/beta hydrolase [Spirochaetaceae bacterium]